MSCTRGSLVASASISNSSQWRVQRCVHGVGVRSLISSTKSFSDSMASSSSAMRRFSPASLPLPLAAPGWPSAVSTAAESTTRPRPWRASCSASLSAKPRSSTPSVTGISPMVTGAAKGCGWCSVFSRWMICRVSATDTCALRARSWLKCVLCRRTSTESRIATTVAERGSSVYRLILPMTWPRDISRTMRCVPSSCLT